MSTTLHTRKLVYIAILAALSFLLMYLQFPIIPGADFLKIDFSILPILVAMLLFDFKAALIVLILRSLLTLLLNNAGPSTFIGIPMNITALGIFTFVLYVIWKNTPSVKQYIIAAVVGTLSLTLTMVALNYFYAVPMYATFANFDIAKFIGLSTYFYTMVIPFNLVQGLIFSIAFYLVHLAIKPILNKVN